MAAEVLSSGNSESIPAPDKPIMISSINSQSEKEHTIKEHATSHQRATQSCDSVEGIKPRLNTQEGDTEGVRSCTGNKAVKDLHDMYRIYRLNSEMSDACFEQTLMDIENKVNPYKIILDMAEALGRIRLCGDRYLLKIIDKYKEVYGRDISDDHIEPIK